MLRPIKCDKETNEGLVAHVALAKTTQAHKSANWRPQPLKEGN